MSFPLSLSDSQWSLIVDHLPVHRQRRYNLRLLVAAIFYLTKTGCQWRNLPPCYPPWQIVYYYFRRLHSTGVLAGILNRLRGQIRLKSGKRAQPSVGIIDSQSVRTGSGVSAAKGWDGAKKLKGRKRHLVTDTQGWPLALRVGSAAATDRGGLAAMAPYLERVYQLSALYADRGYWGVAITFIPVKIVQRSDAGTRWGGRKGKVHRIFEVVPKRWIIERSFGWLTNYRRLSRDYEKRTDCSEALISIAFIAIMINNLT